MPAIKNRSSITLKKLIDAKNHRILEKLKSLWNTIILVILTRKFNNALTLARNPTFKDFYEFLETQVIYLKISRQHQQQHPIFQCAEMSNGAWSISLSCSTCSCKHSLSQYKEFKESNDIL